MEYIIYIIIYMFYKNLIEITANTRRMIHIWQNKNLDSMKQKGINVGLYRIDPW